MCIKCTPSYELFTEHVLVAVVVKVPPRTCPIGLDPGHVAQWVVREAAVGRLVERVEVSALVQHDQVVVPVAIQVRKPDASAAVEGLGQAGCCRWRTIARPTRQGAKQRPAIKANAALSERQCDSWYVQLSENNTLSKRLPSPLPQDTAQTRTEADAWVPCHEAASSGWPRNRPRVHSGSESKPCRRRVPAHQRALHSSTSRLTELAGRFRGGRAGRQFGRFPARLPAGRLRTCPAARPRPKQPVAPQVSPDCWAAITCRANRCAATATGRDVLQLQAGRPFPCRQHRLLERDVCAELSGVATNRDPKLHRLGAEHHGGEDGPAVVQAASRDDRNVAGVGHGRHQAHRRRLRSSVVAPGLKAPGHHRVHTRPLGPSGQTSRCSPRAPP